MVFTKATPNDIPLIQSLARLSWEAAYAEILSAEQREYMLSTMYSSVEINSQMQNRNYHYYLIYENEGENAVGFIGFEHGYEKGTTKLHRIYLLPEVQGKGIGTKALEFLKKAVAESPDRRIILNVNKVNRARATYEKNGFKVYEEGVFHIGEGFVMDDYLMEFVF